MKHKILKAIPMLLIASFIMTGCGNNNSEDEASTETTTVAEETSVEDSTSVVSETTTAETTVQTTTQAATETITAAANENQQEVSVPAPAAGSLSLSYKNTKLTLNTNIANVQLALGQTTDYSEAPSCNYDGLDKVFTYGSVSIYTYPHQSGDLINEIEVSDASISTDKGITPIGKTIDDIKAVYGEPTSVEGSTYKYTNGNCYTYFYDDGSSISYWGIAYEG